VSRLDPSGAVQIDAEHPSRNRTVVGSNPIATSKHEGYRLALGARRVWVESGVSLKIRGHCRSTWAFGSLRMGPGKGYPRISVT
jgi:hypothetical protein